MRRVRKLLAQGRRLYPSCRVLRHQWVRKTMQLEDTWRHARETCYYGGLSFPHRKGCKFCHEHPDAERDHSMRYAFFTGG